MALNLVNTVVTFLQNNPKQKFTAQEIAKWLFETHPEECRKKQQNSKATVNPLNSEKALIDQIAAEIGARRQYIQKKYPQIKTTESRPRSYYFTESSDTVEIEEAESNQPSPKTQNNGAKLREHDLYPLLSEFLWAELALYSKRIDEKRSSNSHGAGGNKWLFPDIVAMENLSNDWHREIKDCVQQYASQKTKLWSFEVKILINRSNVREVFFQAVSNSSWANFGYLVASEIQGADTIKELGILSALHGIGVIQLSTENPSENSVIRIPAKERTEIDWDTANRLTTENKDFLEYIKLIRQFYQTGEIRRSDWDISAELS